MDHIGPHHDREYEYVNPWKAIKRQAMWCSLCLSVAVIASCDIGNPYAQRLLLVCAFSSLLLLLFLGEQIAHRLAYRQRVAIAKGAIVVPASRWSHAETEIPYHQIHAVADFTFGRERYLILHHIGGEYRIFPTMLAPNAFAEVRAQLAARVWESHRSDEVLGNPGLPPPPGERLGAACVHRRIVAGLWIECRWLLRNPELETPQGSVLDAGGVFARDWNGHRVLCSSPSATI